jgi:hypothetical protein
MHTTLISNEPLEVIFANECGENNDLATTRFRRLQNEIELRDKALKEAMLIAKRLGDSIMRKAYTADNRGEYELYEELEMQAIVCSEIEGQIENLRRTFTNG